MRRRVGLVDDLRHLLGFRLHAVDGTAIVRHDGIDAVNVLEVGFVEDLGVENIEIKERAKEVLQVSSW